jgi:CHAD domain-containing protein
MYLQYLNRDFQYLYIRIRNHFYSTSKNFDPDCVHDLRVEIKRIRAFFKLIEAINPEFVYKKNFKAINQLFKAAGDLRDIQVQQALAREWETRLAVRLEAYSTVLQSNERAAKAELAEFFKNYAVKKIKHRGKIIHRVLAKIPEEIALARVNEHLKSLVQRLAAIQAEAGEVPEKLHALRTQAKQTRYTLDILLQCFPNILYPRTLSTRLKRLHHVLGLWHDNQIALELLDKFRKKNSAPFLESQPFNQLEAAVSQAQKGLLRSYEKAWQSLTVQFEKQ